MLRTIIFNIVLFTWFIAWSPILFIGLISSKLERKIAIIEAWGALYIVRIFAGIKYKIHYPLTNENGIPFKHNINTRFDRRAIIASKHMSVLEILILFTHVPNSFFIMKRELLWIPIYGWAFARIGLIGVNRKRGATNMKELKNKVMSKIMDSMTLVIFPEGTRVYPNQKAPLRRGLLFLAEELKLPILPVSVDTGLYWPRRGKMKPGTANIYFEEELPSSATIEQVSKAINEHSC